MNTHHFTEFDVSQANNAGQLIYWQRSEEQSLEVRDDQKHRWLLLDGIVQSVLRHQTPTTLCLPHQQILQALLPAHAAQVLHLGVGGGDFLRWLHERYPGVNQTAIDLNQHVLAIYLRFFQQEERPSLHSQDAFIWLAETSQQYDLILVDLFSDDGSPAALFHSTTYQNLQRCLQLNGKIIINMLPRTDQEWHRVQQLLSCCGEVRSVQIAGFRNYLVWTEPKPATRK